MVWNSLHRLFNFLASLELAVINILVLAAVLAAGTIYEAKYGAAVASQAIYRSLGMQVLLWLFMMNLAASALSRLPWKRHHVAFLVTHLGIIVLLLGSWVTQRRGIDGTIALAPGESTRFVTVDEDRLNVFRAVPGKTYELALTEKLDLSLRKPLKSPKIFPLLSSEGTAVSELKLLRHFPSAARSVRAEDVAAGKGVPAAKFRLTSSRANIDDWFFLQGEKGSNKDLGPARLRFQKGKPSLSGAPDKPILFIYVDAKSPASLPQLAVGHPKQGKNLRFLGAAKPGVAVPLGWMDFVFTMDEYHPSAVPQVEYKELPFAGPMGESLQAIEVELGGERVWLELGASAQLSKDNALYYIQYTKKQQDIGFDLLLKDFRIGFYEGTTRPKSYSSLVSVGPEEHVISMNEPMNRNGFTFYQASYEMNEEGKPQASVFSVNYDPGRGVKYLGSLMICLGIVLMFYFKPRYSGTNRWLMGKKEPA